MTKAEEALNKGLQQGFVGTNSIKQVQRGDFSLASSSADAYVDQWMVKRIGGGQEIASAHDEVVTRLYAGGYIQKEKLDDLGISENQIIDFLKKSLLEFIDKTRLHESVKPPADGDWQYEYSVLQKYLQLPLTVGEESIAYKGQKVFIHIFLISPVE